jgi:multimeric flavodoxin WrbA
MQIVTLLGSARKKGNTATVLNWVEQTLEASGHDVNRVYLHSTNINGCLGCAKCRENPENIACVQDDDAIVIMEHMIAADAILFASPIYFWGFSAQIKALIDRGYALVTNYHRPGHTSLLKGKNLGLLVTGADDYEQNAEGLFTAFDRIVDFLLAQKKGELYVARCTVPENLTSEVKDKAVALAHALVA